MSVHYVPAKRPPTPDIMGAMLEAKVGPELIDVLRVKTNGGTQMRAGLNAETVGEYMQTLKDSDQAWPFPPVVVFFDGTDYWLADGFHRVAAMRQLERIDEIPADVRVGDRRAAVLYAAGANAVHGLRRTNADKRRAVETLLRDEEWAAWSDGEIARRCAVSDRFVASLRKELSPNRSEMPTERTVIRGGTTYQQNTANIGASRPARQLDDAAEDAWRLPGVSGRAAVSQAATAKQAEPAPAPQRPAAWDGVTAHTWDGYADWDDDDDAEYAALSPLWDLPAGAFNSISESRRITRWRVAARLASERRDNIAFSLQETARLLMRAERYAADDAWRADIASRQAAADEAARQAVAEEAASAPAPTQTGMNPLFVKGSLRRWLGTRYENFTTADAAFSIYQMLDNWIKGNWQADLEDFTATLPAGWTQDALDQAIRELHTHFAPDEEEQAAPALPVVNLDSLEVVDSVAGPTGWTDPEPESDLDCYDDESATLAARRINKLHTLKVRFLKTIDLLEEFGELTGRHTATLLTGRELANLIDILDAEMNALEKGMKVCDGTGN